MNIVYTRLDDETKERLDKQAKEENRNRANMVRVMIKDYLEREKMTGLRREDVALRLDQTDASKEVQ